MIPSIIDSSTTPVKSPPDSTQSNAKEHTSIRQLFAEFQELEIEKKNLENDPNFRLKQNQTSSSLSEEELKVYKKYLEIRKKQREVNSRLTAGDGSLEGQSPPFILPALKWEIDAHKKLFKEKGFSGSNRFVVLLGAEAQNYDLPELPSPSSYHLYIQHLDFTLTVSKLHFSDGLFVNQHSSKKKTRNFKGLKRCIYKTLEEHSKKTFQSDESIVKFLMNKPVGCFVLSTPLMAANIRISLKSSDGKIRRYELEKPKKNKLADLFNKAALCIKYPSIFEFEEVSVQLNPPTVNQ